VAAKPGRRLTEAGAERPRRSPAGVGEGSGDRLPMENESLHSWCGARSRERAIATAGRAAMEKDVELQRQRFVGSGVRMWCATA
jgi:hypothetical protein